MSYNYLSHMMLTVCQHPYQHSATFSGNDRIRSRRCSHALFTSLAFPARRQFFFFLLLLSASGKYRINFGAQTQWKWAIFLPATNCVFYLFLFFRLFYVPVKNSCFLPPRAFKKDAGGGGHWEKLGVRLRFGLGIDGRERTWLLALLIDGNEL